MKDYKYPMWFKSKLDNAVVMFTSLDRGVVVKQGNKQESHEVGHESIDWCEHTNTFFWENVTDEYKPSIPPVSRYFSDKEDFMPRNITDSPFAIDASKVVVKERPNVPHYQSGGIEPIEYINSHNFNFNLGNCVKYVTRAGKKGDAITDLKKAIDYLNFEIERLKK